MITLTAVIELPAEQAQADQIMHALTSAFVHGDACPDIAGFKVLDLAVGDRMAPPLSLSSVTPRRS